MHAVEKRLSRRDDDSGGGDLKVGAQHKPDTSRLQTASEPALLRNNLVDAT